MKKLLWNNVTALILIFIYINPIILVGLLPILAALLSITESAIWAVTVHCLVCILVSMPFIILAFKTIRETKYWLYGIPVQLMFWMFVIVSDYAYSLENMIAAFAIQLIGIGLRILTDRLKAKKQIRSDTPTE